MTEWKVSWRMDFNPYKCIREVLSATKYLLEGRGPLGNFKYFTIVFPCCWLQY